MVATLEQWPNYLVATVVFFFLAVSIGLERGLHHTGKWLRAHNQKPLSNALEVMKDELMLLGFISLLLTVFQTQLPEICIPILKQHPMLPCKYEESAEAGEVEGSSCSEGHMPFMSTEGLHQLHILIFLMAIVHIGYSCVTMLLSLYRVHQWKKWEKQAIDFVEKARQMPVEDRRELMKRMKSSFVRRHTGKLPPGAAARVVKEETEDEGPRGRTTVTLAVICFFRQFVHSVSALDYRTLRLAFILTHNAGLKFDFHGYLVRCLEADFIHVVGTNIWLWCIFVLLLLLNVDGWHIFFWATILSCIVQVAVGTKLQVIISTLALEAGKERKLRPRDDLFWLKRPKLLLHFIHYMIFQGSMVQAVYLWDLWQFGPKSCLIDSPYVYVRLGLTIGGQILAAYITLPLYCLVTQMGSDYKHAIFSERVQTVMKSWAGRHKKASSHPHLKSVATAVQTMKSSGNAVARKKSLQQLVKRAVSHTGPPDVANGTVEDASRNGSNSIESTPASIAESPSEVGLHYSAEGMHQEAKQAAHHHGFHLGSIKEQIVPHGGIMELVAEVMEHEDLELGHRNRSGEDAALGEQGVFGDEQGFSALSLRMLEALDESSLSHQEEDASIMADAERGDADDNEYAGGDGSSDGD